MNPVAKAVWFIESHLAEDVTLADIAAVAGVSRFHLVRAFGLASGVPVMRYVRIRRLSEAARALANGAPDILTVALDAGYTSHEAFTRAFRDQFGLTPESARARGSVATLGLMEPIRMNETPRMPLATPRMEDGRSFTVAGLQGHVTFDYIAGVEVAETAALPPDFATLRLAPQRYAVFIHTDHISTVRGTFMAIFNEWLPRLGLQSADAPVFERYDTRFDSRTGMGGFEIWIPVRM